ncbi:hypothetical protein AB4113_01285 [Vibrio breoganii]
MDSEQREWAVKQWVSLKLNTDQPENRMLFELLIEKWGVTEADIELIALGVLDKYLNASTQKPMPFPKPKGRKHELSTYEKDIRQWLIYQSEGIKDEGQRKSIEASVTKLNKSGVVINGVHYSTSDLQSNDELMALLRGTYLGNPN